MLTRDEMETKLAWLATMRLVEISNGSVSIHPAVKEGFLIGYDSTAERFGHDAIREGLTVSLSKFPEASGAPSHPDALNLIEEIIYHALKSEKIEEAWRIYEQRLGGFVNLGWRLGEYERGERICNEIAASAKLYKGKEFPDEEETLCLNEWALYAKSLGFLERAVRGYERANAIDERLGNERGILVGWQNLSEVRILQGCLRLGLEFTEKSVKRSIALDDAHEVCYSLAYRARIRALRGESELAVKDYAAALEWQKQSGIAPDEPLYSIAGIHHACFKAMLGQWEDARMQFQMLFENHKLENGE
jgi:tetratricopeptide (TPR) repeat protein